MKKLSYFLFFLIMPFYTTLSAHSQELTTEKKTKLHPRLQRLLKRA